MLRERLSGSVKKIYYEDFEKLWNEDLLKQKGLKNYTVLFYVKLRL